MKLAEILTGPETWGQGHRKMEDRFCLLGALSQLLSGNAYGYIAGTLPEYKRLERIVGMDVMVWNDTPGRIWEEVSSAVSAYDIDRMLNP